MPSERVQKVGAVGAVGAPIRAVLLIGFVVAREAFDAQRDAAVRHLYRRGGDTQYILILDFRKDGALQHASVEYFVNEQFYLVVRHMDVPFVYGDAPVISSNRRNVA